MAHCVFVNPPSPFLVNDRGSAPLGILYIAAECQARGIETSLWDMTGDSQLAMAFSSDDSHMMDIQNAILDGVIESYVEEDTPVDIFAITATSAQYHSAKRLLSIIKKNWPNIAVAIGGPHVSALPQMAIDDGFNIVAVGEADYDFPANLEQGHVKHDESFILNCKAPRDLDSLQLPARELVDLKSYCANLTVGEGLATTSIFSRGCPYSCAYCQRVMGDSWRIYRARDPNSCLAELDHLAENYGITRHVFVDDIFGLKRKWLQQFCEEMRMRKYEWRCNIRANTLYHDMLPLMYDAGCRCISFGFESAENSILAELSKNTVEHNIKALKSCKDAGIGVKSFFMFGFKGDGQKSADALKDFIVKYHPDSSQIAWVIPLVSTPIYYEAVKLGMTSIDYSKMYHNGKDGHGSLLRLPWHTDETESIYKELVNWVSDYYSRPVPTIDCPNAISNK